MTDTTDLIQRLSDEADLPPPKVTGAPERIWLNYGDLEHDDTHDECYRSGEVTWCDDSVFVSDVEYVRADALEQQAAQIEALRADAERWRAALNVIASWGEGPDVDGEFDEPWSATTARAALRQEQPAGEEEK